MVHFKNQYDTGNGEQVNSSINTSPSEHIVKHTSDSPTLNGILNNEDAGSSSQRNYVSDSHMT